MSALWRSSAPLVLASRSRTRQGLLAQAGIPLEMIDAGIDERAVDAPLVSSGASAAETALCLARAKALAVSSAMPERLVLGADQTLSLDGQILSKPPDSAAAVAQLEQLSGRAHELCSALCLARGGVVVFETVPVARLKVRPLSSSFVAAYVASAGETILSSVGAYQVEGLGIHLFEAIEGDHSTILGLPLLPLLTYLRKEGYVLR